LSRSKSHSFRLADLLSGCKLSDSIAPESALRDECLCAFSDNETKLQLGIIHIDTGRARRKGASLALFVMSIERSLMAAPEN